MNSSCSIMNFIFNYLCFEIPCLSGKGINFSENLNLPFLCFSNTISNTQIGVFARFFDLTINIKDNNH